MPFTLGDRYRIIEHLSLPIAQESTVVKCMDAVTTKSDLLVNRILGILEQLDDISSKLAAERSSPNSALVKADVLEWQAGARSHGMLQQRGELVRQLANLLGIEVKRSRPSGTLSIEVQNYST